MRATTVDSLFMHPQKKAAGININLKKNPSWMSTPGFLGKKPNIEHTKFAKEMISEKSKEIYIRY
jgi:hypothetical protein